MYIYTSPRSCFDHWSASLSIFRLNTIFSAVWLHAANSITFRSFLSRVTPHWRWPAASGRRHKMLALRHQMVERGKDFCWMQSFLPVSEWSTQESVSMTSTSPQRPHRDTMPVSKNHMVNLSLTILKTSGTFYLKSTAVNSVQRQRTIYFKPSLFAKTISDLLRSFYLNLI